MDFRCCWFNTLDGGEVSGLLGWQGDGGLVG